MKPPENPTLTAYGQLGALSVPAAPWIENITAKARGVGDGIRLKGGRDGLEARAPRTMLAGLLLVLCFITSAMSAETDYSAAVQKLEAAVRAEMQQWGIRGMSMVLTDGTRVVHTAGFGEANADSVFRAGSISKLFNAVAVMQLVEAGKLKLDAPFADLPGAILSVNPFPDSPPVTLRQMLCHRSGIQREAPVGGYLDDAQPSLAATCESVRGCVLVTPPNAKTRYSNIAPSLAGQVVAVVSGMSFEKYQRQHILDPLGMTRSSWRQRDVPGGKVITSRMRVADGRGGFHHIDTPLFDLGTVPAGNLFTTAPDLARFVIMLASGGALPSGRLLKTESLTGMMEPQLDPAGSFGLGFALGKFRGHRTAGHNGAVYGHSASLTFLPDTKIGVVLLANEDLINARAGRLSNLAVSLMLETKTGEKPPSAATRVALSEEALREFTGRFESQSLWAELRTADGQLTGDYASQPCALTPVAKDKFLLNSRLHDDAPLIFQRDAAGRITGFTVDPQSFRRVPAGRVPVPDEWKQYCGGYGPDFIPIVIRERDGRLYATTENMIDYRLTPVNRHVFALPAGMYADEHIVFLAEPGGKVNAIDFANMILRRTTP